MDRKGREEAGKKKTERRMLLGRVWGRGRREKWEKRGRANTASLLPSSSAATR